MKKEVKIIFHIDLNAFFATCAIIKEPYLANKIFVVGGSAAMRKGVLSTASYKARELGIKSGMSIHEALNIYPQLLVVPLDFKLYHKQSMIFFNFLKKYSNLILKGSIDEAYVDMTELSKTRHPLEIAKEIQDTLYKEYKLPVSIGIGPTLFLAKMASELKKPLGITVIRRRDIEDKILPLSIKDMFGIGKKTAPLLVERGILTIGDFLKKENKSKILEIMKLPMYESYIEHILGYSSDVVDPKKYAIPKSVTNETTLNFPIDQTDLVINEIKEMFSIAYDRLISDELIAKGVTIKFKTKDFKLITRSQVLNDYTDERDILYHAIEELVEQHYKNEPVRLIGCGFYQVMQKRDLKIDYNLFTYDTMSKRENDLFRVMDSINKKYPDSVKKGVKDKI